MARVASDALGAQKLSGLTIRVRSPNSSGLRVVAVQMAKECSTYAIMREAADGMPVLSHHRYKELRDLSLRVASMVNVPFPPRQPTRRQTPAFLVQRAHELERYLRAVVDSPAASQLPDIQRHFPSLPASKPEQGLSPPLPPLAAARNLVAAPRPGGSQPSNQPKPERSIPLITPFLLVVLWPLGLGIGSLLDAQPPPGILSTLAYVHCFWLGACAHGLSVCLPSSLPASWLFSTNEIEEEAGDGQGLAGPGSMDSIEEAGDETLGDASLVEGIGVGLAPCQVNNSRSSAVDVVKFLHAPVRQLPAHEAVHVQSQATPAERFAVSKVQQVVGGCDDLTALCFLRACKGKADKAAAAVKEHRAWREAERVEDIVTEQVEPHVDAILSTTYSPRLLPGLDSKGRPVIFSQLGQLDVARLAAQGVTMEHVVRRHIRECERMRLAVEASPCPELGHLLIMDISGCTIGKFARGWRLWKKVAEVGAKQYPELMGALCIVRAPSAAVHAVAQVKKFLDPVTAAKIELHSSSKTLRALSAHLTSAQVPSELLDPLQS